MSSKKRKKTYNSDKKNIDNKVEDKNKNDIDNDMEECDKLLEQLDEIEKNDISSRVKSLIREDKEAIKKMNSELKKIDEDDMDYLDDEPEKDSIVEKDSSSEDNNNASDKLKAENEEDKSTMAETDEDNDNQENEEANLDFLANLNKDDKKNTDRIRKTQPRRLSNGNSDSSINGNAIDRIKSIIKKNTKNFAVGTAIAFLFVALVIALAVDASNSDKDNEKEKLNGEFITIDTTPMIDTINNYYAALNSGDKDSVRKMLSDSSTITDEEIAAKCEEAKVYYELVGNSFMVTDCYVQKGLHDNEYIAYMKFQIKIKSIETPAVGIFTCYFVDKSTKDKVDYKISSEVNDKSSSVYKHILKMSSCKNVTEIFKKADEELKNACSNDADLKAIVDALENNEEESAVDEATTEPVESTTAGK